MAAPIFYVQFIDWGNYTPQNLGLIPSYYMAQAIRIRDFIRLGAQRIQVDRPFGNLLNPFTPGLSYTPGDLVRCNPAGPLQADMIADPIGPSGARPTDLFREAIVPLINRYPHVEFIAYISPPQWSNLISDTEIKQWAGPLLRKAPNLSIGLDTFLALDIPSTQRAFGKCPTTKLLDLMHRNHQKAYGEPIDVVGSTNPNATHPQMAGMMSTYQDYLNNTNRLRHPTENILIFDGATFPNDEPARIAAARSLWALGYTPNADISLAGYNAYTAPLSGAGWSGSTGGGGEH